MMPTKSTKKKIKNLINEHNFPLFKKKLLKCEGHFWEINFKIFCAERSGRHTIVCNGSGKQEYGKLGKSCF
jgi:hypothetical protein